MDLKTAHVQKQTYHPSTYPASPTHQHHQPFSSSTTKIINFFSTCAWTPRGVTPWVAQVCTRKIVEGFFVESESKGLQLSWSLWPVSCWLGFGMCTCLCFFSFLSCLSYIILFFLFLVFFFPVSSMSGARLFVFGLTLFCVLVRFILPIIAIKPSYSRRDKKKKIKYQVR